MWYGHSHIGVYVADPSYSWISMAENATKSKKKEKSIKQQQQQQETVTLLNAIYKNWIEYTRERLMMMVSPLYTTITIPKLSAPFITV